MPRKPLLILVAALALATAHAERADREKEIVVGADRLLADDANRTSTFDPATFWPSNTVTPILDALAYPTS